MIQRKYLIFHFAFFSVLFECDKKRDEWKNSIICKWFAFNRSHYSKGKAKQQKKNTLTVIPTFVRRIIIHLAMHKQSATQKKTRKEKEREKRNIKPRCHSKAQAFNYHFLSLLHAIHYVLLLFATANNCHSTMTIEIKWASYASVCLNQNLHTPNASTDREGEWKHFEII